MRARLPELLFAAVIVVGVSTPLSAQSMDEMFCQRGESKTGPNTTIRDDNHGNRIWRVSWSSGSCSIDMAARGDVRLKRDLSDIESLSSGGYFELTHRMDGVYRRYEVDNRLGRTERHYYVDRRERELDAEGRRWVATMILELERHTGFAAEWRVSDLLRTGGVSAVLREVERLSSDHVQSRYLTILVDSVKLNDGDVRALMKTASSSIASDHNLSQTLIALGKRGLVTPAVAGDYVAATSTIQSSHDKRRTLQSVLTLDNLQPGTVVQLLNAASTISSDHDRAELLIATGKQGFPSGEARTAYLNAASEIRSDHDKRRVLSRLAAERLTDDQLIAVLRTATSIRSDHDLSSLLVELTQKHTIDGKVRDAYLAAVESIASDHDHRRALSALVKSTAKM